MFNTYKHFDSVVDLHRSLTSEQFNCYLARCKAYASRFKWSTALEPIWHNCLIHVSPLVDDKVEYFASVDAMVRNRTTRTSPEMFLERYLSTAPLDLKSAWRLEVLGQVAPTVEFIPNTDPDGWYRVYDDGPYSCMQGSDRVRQYAHPKNDLALAYMLDGGRIVARTIVNQKTKNYMRIYSRDHDDDGRDSDRMAMALRKLGYTRDIDCLEGQMIHVHYLECCVCDNEVPVGPYFDGNHGHIQLNPENDREGVVGNDGIGVDYEEPVSCGNH